MSFITFSPSEIFSFYDGIFIPSPLQQTIKIESSSIDSVRYEAGGIPVVKISTASVASRVFYVAKTSNELPSLFSDREFVYIDKDDVYNLETGNVFTPFPGDLIINTSKVFSSGSSGQSLPGKGTLYEISFVEGEKNQTVYTTQSVYHKIFSFYYAGNTSSNTEIDWGLGTLQEIVLNNNPTLSFTNPIIGQNLRLLVKKDGVKTVSWPGNIYWKNNAPPSFAAVSYIDPSFVTGSGFSGASNTTNSLDFQSNGNIIVGGSFTTYNGVSSQYIVRLSPSGTRDSSFNASINGDVNVVKVLTGDKIIIGGSFTTVSSTSRNRIARLNSDGTIDTSFNPGTGFNDIVSFVHVFTNGKILVGGNFTTFNGTSRSRIAQLNSDGTLDLNFNPGTGFNGNVLMGVIQPDNKIILGGQFTSYNSSVSNYIVRLNTDGTIDATFNTGTGFNQLVRGLYLTASGKIMVAGQFSQFNGTNRVYLCRLNNNGSLDTTFDPGTSANSVPVKLIQQTDDDLILFGSFTTYRNVEVPGIARINSDGTIDTGFNAGTGFNSFSSVTEGVPTFFNNDLRNVFFTGNFTTFNGVTVNRIVKLIISPNYDVVTFNYNGTDYIGAY